MRTPSSTRRVRPRRILAGLLLFLGACSEAAPGPEANPQSEKAARQAAESAALWQAQGWVALGDDLNPSPGSFISAPALAAAPRLEPMLTFSATDPVTFAEQTLIFHWHWHWDSGSWSPLGAPLGEAGPALAQDRQRQLYACTGGGPFVHRWTGTEWLAVGGDISEETGYRGTRYQVERCSDLALDDSGVPVVVWSAHHGPKADAVYAARFSPEQQKWEGLGPDGVGSARATSARLALDEQDQPVVVTFSPGGSYGGGATTRVWSFRAGAWTQLGGDMPATAGPVIGAGRSGLHIALSDESSGELRVMRWRDEAWRDLPSPGSGSGPSLAFSPFGSPLVAYVEAAAPETLRVQVFAAGAWRHVGPGVAEVAGKSVELDLRLDVLGRPIVAWSAADSTSGSTSVSVRRHGAPVL